MRRPSIFSLFFFNDTATTEIYTLSLHDALPILIQGDKVAVNPQQAGTKMAALYRLELGAGETVTLKIKEIGKTHLLTPITQTTPMPSFSFKKKKQKKDNKYEITITLS